jgi:hypothetical protein
MRQITPALGGGKRRSTGTRDCTRDISDMVGSDIDPPALMGMLALKALGSWLGQELGVDRHRDGT